MHEAELHELNCFVTLTYNEDQIPPGQNLKYKHFQDFLKRLRKAHAKRGKIRFYMCGEYGEAFDRPHYHACLFGIDFPDKYKWRKNNNGDQLYRSASLERLWRHGNSEIGAVTFQSAAYVARYVMKKITGDRAASHYTYVDQHGEIHQRTPEFNHMSLRPGIGARWFDKYNQDVFPSDRVIARGRPILPPRYYDKLLERLDEATHSRVKSKRNTDAIANAAENKPSRLRAKEAVATARAAFLKREI